MNDLTQLLDAGFKVSVEKSEGHGYYVRARREAAADVWGYGSSPGDALAHAARQAAEPAS